MGAPNFVMRLFEIDPDGYSPFHTHAWEHEVFVLEGEGTVLTEKTAYLSKQAT
jgi:quercetin dioxygenase-like cupin family protein